MSYLITGPNSTEDDIAYELDSPHGIIGCDIETPSIKDRTVLGVGFAFESGHSVYMTPDHHEFPHHLLMNPDTKVVFHNARFDVPALRDEYGYTVANVKDSLVLPHLLGMKGKLSSVCKELFGREERNIKDLMGKDKTLNNVPIDLIGQRGAMDAWDCLEVWQTLRPIVPEKAYDLEERFEPVRQRIESRGILVDHDNVERHRAAYRARIEELREQANAYGFNVSKPSDLARYLEEKGFKVPKKRIKNKKTGKVTVNPIMDKHVLKGIYGELEEAKIRLEFGTVNSLYTNILSHLHGDKFVRDNGRVYPKVNSDVTESGRLSRSEPATQNINRKLRDVFRAPNGRYLLHWDFSQIELRWAAYLWNIKSMTEAFQAGIDIHAQTVANVVKAGVGSVLGTNAEDRRRRAKEVIFGGVLYMGDDYTLWRNNQIPRPIGRQLISAIHLAWPELLPGQKEVQKFALKYGYTETYYGRRRNESRSLQSPNMGVRNAAIRELVNHTIQGSAAETMKEGLIIRDSKGYSDVVHTVHDSSLEEIYPQLFKGDYELHEIQEGLAPFPTPVDWGVGLNWMEAEQDAK